MKKIRYLALTFFQFVFKFGLGYCLEIAFTRLIGRTRYRLYKTKHRITLRKGSSDFVVFLQVFLNDEYNIQINGPVRTIIDAGGNIGLAAIYFAMKYPKAKIYSLEPEEENYKTLEQNIRGFNNIIPLQAALWGGNEEINVELAGGNGWAQKVSYSESGTIKGLTIPHLTSLYNLTEIDLLKIDIEGSEFHLFDEYSKTWINRINNIVIELHDWIEPSSSQKFFSALSHFNYQMKISGENIYVYEIQNKNTMS